MRRLMYLGDIHGGFNIINQYIKMYGLKDLDIIQVGDFGVGFNTFEKELRNLKMTNDVLEKNNIHLWAIRGNHDYKPYFDNDPFNLSNIHLVKDYTVLNLAGKNIDRKSTRLNSSHLCC
jgi:metallophosphoesterase superfamily enzyme